MGYNGGASLPVQESPQSTRIRLLRIAAGVLVTLTGLTALTVAVGWGATAADVALELGAGIGLSGALWWCGVRLRGERPSSPTDYSALLIVGAAGCVLVLWAVSAGKQSREVLTSAGAAVVTLWLFIGLEQQFELEPGDGLEPGDMPLWLKLITLPIAPFFWWWFRDFELPVLRSPPVDFNPKEYLRHLDDLELSEQLGSWDSDSPYRDPAYYNEVFSPTVDDVERHLGVALPQPLVTWIEEKADQTIPTVDGGTLTVWTLPVIRMHPVDLPDAIVCFATETEPESQAEVGEPGVPQDVFVVGVDLRPGPLDGTVVRGQVLPGNAPRWPASESVQVIASSFEQWRAHLLAAA
jgi:hypothetical protein